MVLKCSLWSCISLGLMLAGNAVCQDQTPAPKDDQKKADAAPARETIAKPLTDKQKRKRDEKLRKELETPYKKWLNEDVVYIITDEEKTAFHRLATDEEREQFIEQFWPRPQPSPHSGHRRERVQGRALPAHRLLQRPLRFGNPRLEDGSRTHLHHLRAGRRNRVAPLRRHLRAAHGRGRR